MSCTIASPTCRVRWRAPPPWRSTTPPCRSFWRWPTRARAAPCSKPPTCATASISRPATSPTPPWPTPWASPIGTRASCSRLKRSRTVGGLGARRHRFAGGLGLHAAKQVVLAGKIDAQAAFRAQIVAVRPETDMHHVLVAHLLHELHGRAEITVLGNQEGDVVNIVHGVGDQVGGDQGVELLFRRDRNAADGKVARAQPIVAWRAPQNREHQEPELVL